MRILENKYLTVFMYSGITLYALIHYFGMLVASRMGSHIDTNSALHAYMLLVAALVIALQFSRPYRIYGWAGLPILSLLMNHLFNADPFIVPGFLGEIIVAGIMVAIAWKFTEMMKAFDAN